MSGRRKRERRRRWVTRRSRLRAPGAPASRALERAGIEVRREGAHLRLVAADYHAGPLHLDAGDLAALGLVPVGPEAGRPTSVAAAWSRSARVSPDRARRGPGLDPAWGLPQGLRRGDLLLARVQGGLDVFVLGYDARPVSLTLEDLRQLQLAPAPPS